MSAAAISVQHQLRRHLFGGVPAPLDKGGKELPVYVAMFSGKRRRDGSALRSTTSRYFLWPKQSAEATRWIQDETNRGRETYQCAHLVTAKRRVKPNAAQMIALYVDGDGAQPGPDLPRPTATVESSPGRHQFYWRLNRAIDPTIGEQLNRRLANAMQADMSGWDLTQLLRPPGTHNWKYDSAPTVEIISIENTAYDPDELDQILPPLPAEQTKERPSVQIGRSTTAPPIGGRDQRARERMYAAKRGSEIQTLAAGGSISKDVSGDDQSYANALAFWFDKDPARMAAEFMRSGRVRDKLHEVHYADGRTYLEGTIGTAIGGCSQSFRELTGYDAGDEPPQIQFAAPDEPTTIPTEEPMTLEAALVEIRRLQRRALDQDDRIEQLAGLVHDQQTIIRTERTGRQEAVETVRLIGEILARPREHMTADFKVHTIVTILETHSRASRGVSKLPGAVLEERTGQTKNKVSDNMRDLAARDGSPIQRRLTREWVADELGQTQPITVSEVIPLHATVTESMTAALTMGGPSSREQQRRQRDRERTESRTWGRCSTHDNDLVALKGYCPDCGEVVGERVMQRSEFDALNPLIPGFRDSASPSPAPVVVGTKGPGIRESDQPPVSLLDYAATRVEAPPTRCPAPNCRAMQFRQLPDGSWRCLKSGHDPYAYELAAVAGGEE